MKAVDENVSSEPPAPQPSILRALCNPVTLIALIILIGVFFLIGSAIFGFDRGVLTGMSNIEYARGLITYLFAVVTIGTAVVLVVSALTGGDDKSLARGKDILSLLLGVFGTIVGFYFGSEVATARPESQQVRLAPVRFGDLQAGKVAVMSFVSGGTPPYRYSILVGGQPRISEETAGADGWINAVIEQPQVGEGESVPITIEVRDAADRTARQSAFFVSRSAPAPAAKPAVK
jgi:hypothetical protein